MILGRRLTVLTRDENSMARSLNGYLVADPAICDGQLTFRGTSILAADVLEQVATGRPWESIVEDWEERLPRRPFRTR